MGLNGLPKIREGEEIMPLRLGGVVMDWGWLF